MNFFLKKNTKIYKKKNQQKGEENEVHVVIG